MGLYLQANLRRLLGGGETTEYRFTEAPEKGPWCMHDLPYDQPCVCCGEMEKRREQLR